MPHFGRYTIGQKSDLQIPDVIGLPQCDQLVCRRQKYAWREYGEEVQVMLNASRIFLQLLLHLVY